MTDTPPEADNLEVLTTLRTEVEASVLVAALAEVGIKAVAAGGYTSGFKAEAPGDVQILVKQDDLERAHKALATIHG